MVYGFMWMFNLGWIDQDGYKDDWFERNELRFANKIQFMFWQDHPMFAIKLINTMTSGYDLNVITRISMASSLLHELFGLYLIASIIQKKEEGKVKGRLEIAPHTSFLQNIGKDDGLNTYDALFHSQIHTSMFHPQNRVKDFDTFFVDEFLDGMV